MSKNGTMFWPATTTTAIIDPTSQEILSDILNKKVSVGIAGNIASTVLPPVILESITTDSTDIATTAAQSGKTYFCPDLGKIRHYYSIEISQNTVQVVPENTDPSPELIYYDKGTDKFYRWNAVAQEMVSIVTETSGEEPTFLGIDLADLESETVSTFLTEYYLNSEEDPLPSSTFEDSEGKYKNVILRIRVLEEDNPEEMTSEDIDENYWNFPLKLTPLALETTDSAWNSYSNFLFGSCIYSGFIYSVLVCKDINDNYSIGIQKIKLENLGIITSLPAYEDVPIYPTAGDDISTAFGKINRIVQSHEEVTARALLDLNSRIQNLPSGGGGGMQSTTWSALKTLRDGGNLTPGQLYRITDYTCTTTQTNTQSAGHVFDVIVLALSESTLSETAWADHHEGDTYFSNCKLEAWELKYCLSNDTTRFKWADSTNGKGVIYWMKDEWNNECSYDFKNIQFRAAINTGTGLFSSFTDVGGVFLYTFTWLTQQNEPQDCSTIFPNSASANVGKVYNNNIKNTTYDSYQYYLPFNIFYASYIDSYYFGGIRGNSIGKDCDHVVIRAKGANITNNIVIGNNCKSIRVSGTNILVGNNCSNITTGTYFDDIIIGNNCTNITLTHPSDPTKSLYYQHIIIESHVENLQLYPESTPNYNTKFKNILIESGISGESSNNQKYIYTSVDNDFLTTYKPANSVEISV